MQLHKISFLLKKSSLQKLAHPKIFFYAGLWMMLLLVVGTFSQQEIGLYQAQAKYFSSFFFWFYGIPLPAGRSLMGLMLLSLMIKILFFQGKTKISIGSGLFHLGAVFLLSGGFITGLFSQENYMVIPEKTRSNILHNYHQVELAVLSSKKILATFSEKVLSSNSILEKNIPFQIKIQEFMKNMEPVQKKQTADVSFKGFAKIYDLKKKKSEKVNEENLAGLTFQITRENKVENYAIFENMPIKQTLKWENKKYILQLRPARTYLPFFMELQDFKKENYPGTNQARSYKSIVHIVEGTDKQKRVIEMNQPLRYKGWTFYQSSFMQTDKETSVLAVVSNKGRAFPYISSLIICCGLLIHILINVPFFATRKRERE